MPKHLTSKLTWSLTLSLVVLIGAFGLLPASAFGQTTVWLGGAGNWSDASKWSAGVPTATSNVFIDNGNGVASAVTVDGGFVCNNLTIDAGDSITITSGNLLAIYGTTITNKGRINVTDNPFPAALNVATSTNVMLTGGGTVTLTDVSQSAAALINGVGASTLTNVNNTIQGSGSIGQGGPLVFVNQASGVVNANQPGHGLVISANGGVTNAGLMEATGGGTLNFGGPTVNNSGGTIASSGVGSTALLVSPTVIQGGTLTTSGGGVMQSVNVVLDGATHGVLNNQGTLAVPGPGGGAAVLMGTINNTGSIVVSDGNGGFTFVQVAGGQNAMLTGGGTVILNDVTHSAAAGLGGPTGSTLTNVNNVIQGSGQIGPSNSGLVLINQKKGVINANQSGLGLAVTTASVTNLGLMEATNGGVLAISSVLTNSGKFSVANNSLMQITGPFTNFSGTTLTGGMYMVTGTLQITGANIVNDAANITLTGAASTIIDQSSNDGLRNFAAITSKGALTLHSKKTLVTPADLSSAGKLTVGAGTTLTVTGGYTQTAGTTTVDGTLTAPAGMTVQGGKVFGKGKITSTVVSSGAVTAGDSPTKTGKLSPSTYTQNANGSLNIAIGGLTVSKQYGQLAVANGTSLNGTLNVTLINNFVPAIGDTFTILTCSARTSQFATVNGLSINGGEHFEISYGATSVTLQVASGP